MSGSDFSWAKVKNVSKSSVSKDKQQLKESVTNRSAVQETLKGVLYGEGENDDRWKHGNVWQMNWKRVKEQ